VRLRCTILESVQEKARNSSMCSFLIAIRTTGEQQLQQLRKGDSDPVGGGIESLMRLFFGDVVSRQRGKFQGHNQHAVRRVVLL